MIVKLSEAKTHLSRLVDRAVHGEKIVIAKHGLALIELVPYRPGKPRKLGQLAGKLKIPENFSDADPDIEHMFYGDAT